MSVFWKRKGGHGDGGGGGHGGGDDGGGGGHGDDDSSSGGGSSSAPSGYTSASEDFATPYGSAYAFASGSSTRTLVPPGVAFSGREIGGGVRGGVWGTETFGSGWPAGEVSGSWVEGRDFPYGFWPVYYRPGYFGDDEYGPENNASRPGGPEMTALIASNGSAYPSTNTYFILGDESSVRAVLDALVLNCSVVNTTLATYSGSNMSMPQPEQAVQYYRASSFVLLLDGYNNSAALPANSPLSNTSAVDLNNTPLPAGLNTTFLSCVNNTIGNSVPMASSASSVTVGSGLLGILPLLCVLLAWLG